MNKTLLQPLLPCLSHVYLVLLSALCGAGINNQPVQDYLSSPAKVSFIAVPHQLFCCLVLFVCCFFAQSLLTRLINDYTDDTNRHI